MCVRAWSVVAGPVSSRATLPLTLHELARTPGAVAKFRSIDSAAPLELRVNGVANSELSQSQGGFLPFLLVRWGACNAAVLRPISVRLVARS